jgi:hypothetical protein
VRLSRRHVIALAAAAVLLIAYAAAGFLAVPHFARQGASDFVRTHYGRRLTIGDLRFNPFTLNLDVTGVVLPDADGQRMISFDRLHVGLQLASLWRLGPSFSEILLERPYVRAVLRPDGALNLADLGKGFPPAPQQKKTAPVRFSVGRLAVIEGSTAFEDRTHPTPFRADFKPIAFELHDFSTTRATGDTYTLTAASPQGERLIWSGTVRLAPLSSHGRFEIADLKARTLWSYLSASLPFEIDSGVIALSGDYDVSTAAAGPIGVKLNVHSTTVTSLGIKPRGGTSDYIALGRIEVHDTRLDLGRRAVEVAKVQLSGGEIQAWLGEQGRLNLLELTGAAPAASASEATGSGAGGGDATIPAGGSAPAASGGAGAGGAASAWTVSVPDIAVSGLKVSAEDRQLKPAAAVVLDPLNAHVAGFNLSPDDVLDVELDSAVNSSGRITAQAKVAPRAGSVTAHLEAEHLGLAALQPLLAKYTSMTLLKGELGARIDFERSAEGSLGVMGDTRISDLSTVDNELQKDFIRWRELRIADISYRSQPASLKIGSVTALAPYVRVIIAPDRSLNIRQILTPPGAKPPQMAQNATAQPAAAPGASVTTAPSVTAAPSAAATPKAGTRKGKSRAAAGPAPAPAPLTPFPMSIGAFRMVNGSADYTDLWIKPSFALGMQALHGAVTGLSSDPSSRARVQFDGKLASFSPLHIAGEVNLLSAALYTDITLSFKDLDLTIVNPYSGYFVGYKIDKGKLSVDVSYKVEQRQLSATQHFVVDQLELGDPVESPEAMHLPLKLAVALLKDRNGVIDVPFPMSGSLDDPTFSIGPIIWKMFVNLIAKAATAPFALLGRLFGGGENVNIMEFAAGSAELNNSAQDQLVALNRAMQERPQLKLDVPIVSSQGLDRPQLAQVRLREALAARVASTRQGRKHPQDAAELALADPAKHLQLLVEQFQADLGKDAPLPASALAVQAGKKKEPADLDAAIADLEAALVNHLQIPDADLEALGRSRAQAIQNALLSNGQIDPARVFIVNPTPKPDSGDTVKVELAVH